MKIRQGFVSNSSSSSFVVGFKRGAVPQSAAEVQKLLFGDAEQVHYYEHTIQAKEAAEQVFGDMTREPHTPEKIEEAVLGGYLDGEPELPDDVYRLKDEAWRQAWDAYDQRREAFHRQVLEQLLAKAKAEDLVLYSFTYADEDGHFYMVMEHGGIFERAPLSFRISNH
ncbi:MAG: hypothetical protein ABFE07_28765 [Armatimonadia bacterium]